MKYLLFFLKILMSLSPITALLTKVFLRASVPERFYLLYFLELCHNFYAFVRHCFCLITSELCLLSQRKQAFGEFFFLADTTL